MHAEQVRECFDQARVAHLATVDRSAHQPHVVPVTFARLGPDLLITAVDHKPKRTTALRRLANIAGNPPVAVLVDHYEEDWTRLWWARADGTARLSAATEEPDALAALVARYPQYAERPPSGTVILITVVRWIGWTSAAPAG